MTPELAELIADLQLLDEMTPIERARRCPELIDEAKAALALERGAAMTEAVDSGDWTGAAMGRELGVSRQTVNDMITRYRKHVRTTAPREG